MAEAFSLTAVKTDLFFKRYYNSSRGEIKKNLNEKRSSFSFNFDYDTTYSTYIYN